MEPKQVKKGTVVQVKQGASLPEVWHGTLMIVQHVAPWGVRAGLLFPAVVVDLSLDRLKAIPGVGYATATKILEEFGGDQNVAQDVTFLLLPYPDFEVVGEAPLVPVRIESEVWPVKQ